MARTFTRRAALAAALCLTTVSCDANGVGPEWETPCRLPGTSLDAAAFGGVSDEGLQAAALDASTRLVANVATGAAGTELQSSVASLERALSVRDEALACRSATSALRVLATLPDDPETRPDRAVLALTVEVLSAELRGTAAE